MSEFKTYLFEYPYQGEHWGFEIKAASKEDAEARVKALGWARYQGETFLKIPVPMGGFLTDLYSKIKALRLLFFKGKRDA
jgi:hypothetical protein